jgi:hypothetical protein
VILGFLLTRSTLSYADPLAALRRITRESEFEFAGWTLSALEVKLEQSSLGATDYLSTHDRQALVREFVELTRTADELDARQLELTAEPARQQPDLNAASNAAEIRRTRARLSALQPQIETILQEQVAVILSGIGLDVGGLTLPPVSFHFTRLPVSVIISPREVIRQEASMQLDPDLSLEQQVSLEHRIEGSLDVSALIVPLGGVGTYPTMIQENPSLPWIAQVIAHEWAHNYLFFRPLGFFYETDLDASPELRTMNETAASLFGNAVGRMVLERYYPDLLPPLPVTPSGGESAPSAFDFRREMHLTRIEVDALLAEREVNEAEAYMEARRQVFWNQGYHIRRLNQAYFAFYGAYADEPGGAAGADPVGEAVRAFWERIASPAEFLRQIGRLRSFPELEERLEQAVSSTG